MDGRSVCCLTLKSSWHEASHFLRPGFLQLGLWLHGSWGLSLGMDLLADIDGWLACIYDDTQFISFNVSVPELQNNHFTRSLFIQDDQILIQSPSKPSRSNTRQLAFRIAKPKCENVKNLGPLSYSDRSDPPSAKPLQGWVTGITHWKPIIWQPAFQGLQVTNWPQEIRPTIALSWQNWWRELKVSGLSGLRGLQVSASRIASDWMLRTGVRRWVRWYLLTIKWDWLRICWHEDRYERWFYNLDNSSILNACHCIDNLRPAGE